MMTISEETICEVAYIMNPVKLKNLNLHREKVVDPMSVEWEWDDGWFLTIY